MVTPKLLAPDNGVIDLKNKTITFTALPCPLPEVWRKELIALGRAKDRVGIEAWERRARQTIGLQHQRAYIPSTSEYNHKAASCKV